jgi:1-aminocyclopropane-1-carboxylate deaminase/D-cysteine desulfhydrase-like pyridoxal-dependent ACC family enzyme
LSSTIYGGNKVRTLEFQLACAASIAVTEKRKRKLFTVGATGSNQIVAVAAHVSRSYSSNLEVVPLMALPEASYDAFSLFFFFFFIFMFFVHIFIEKPKMG